MKVDVVVDVGNSRIKWGRCHTDGVGATVALPHHAPDAWEEQLRAWGKSGPLNWVVTGVKPQAVDGLTAWITRRGDRVQLLTRPDQLPLQVALPAPDRVGIDRLLNAVAAKSRIRKLDIAIIVDAGSAVTVDLVDGTGAFRGGAILPGLRLMSQALHDHTALLPLVEVKHRPAPLGTSTVAAIEAGVYYGTLGAITRLIMELGSGGPHGLDRGSLFFTGGDAALLTENEQYLRRFTLWPEMTLEGIRLSAEALP